MKIAIAHDYFTQLGGAEKVAEELFKLFPGADVLTTVALADKLPEGIKHARIITTWMQRLPFLHKWYRLYFPLYPLAVNFLDTSHYDLVISSSSGYIKGLRVKPNATHICYCHTPMRWAWSYDAYASRETFGAVLRMLLPPLIRRVQRWDINAARQPDHFIANSHVVAQRIQKFYGRTAIVIEPPIDVNRFTLSMEEGTYYIVLARLVAYKRIDLAVDACNLLGRKLVVIGGGTALTTLQERAGETIQFVGRVSDEEVNKYVRHSKALIFPGEEDFGMAPLEVAAAGRPTIAYRAGGAIETVIEGKTGMFFDEPTAESLVQAIIDFEQRSWFPLLIRKHAENYSTEVFASRVRAFVALTGVPID